MLICHFGDRARDSALRVGGRDCRDREGNLAKRSCFGVVVDRSPGELAVAAEQVAGGISFHGDPRVPKP
jgi:hypothetical protein